MQRLEGETPAVVVRAPLRVSFGGGGTDLPAYYLQHGGTVVSAAITRYCYVVAEPRWEGGIGISSADYRMWDTFAVGVRPVPDGTLALPKAAIDWYWDRSAKLDVNLFMASEVPPGSGLGSSSAMSVALAKALATWTGSQADAGELARIASWMEIDRLAMPIGRQDQYASAFGGLNWLEFSGDGVQVTPLGLPNAVTCALNSRLLLFSTGQTRNSAAILRKQSADATSKRAVINSLHRLKGLAREMRDALTEGRLDDFGQLLHFAWVEKKRLSRRISSAAIDRSYEVARDQGALGGKIAGAGGGGFMLLYCPPERQPAVRSAMAEFGLQELSFNFDLEGVKLLGERSQSALPVEALRAARPRHALGATA